MREKKMGRALRPATSRTRARMSRWCWSLWSPWKRLSMSTMAPSTSSPKSRAPRLIRLPGTSRAAMAAVAKAMESGMMLATRRPARHEPRKPRSTSITRSPPSTRLTPLQRLAAMVFALLVSRPS